METEKNTEKKILEIAENEFLEKGYVGAKTTEIARKAGVTHAMLHYYYRTKDKLFQQIFEEKARFVASQLNAAIDEGGSPLERIEHMVGVHFDFVTHNYRLVLFLFNEVRQNEDLFQMFRSIISPQVFVLEQRLSTLIREGVEQGILRKVSSMDLLLNMLSMNLMQGFLQAMPNLIPIDNQVEPSQFRENRRREVIETVLSRIRPYERTENNQSSL